MLMGRLEGNCDDNGVRVLHSTSANHRKDITYPAGHIEQMEHMRFIVNVGGANSYAGTGRPSIVNASSQFVTGIRFPSVT